MSEKKELSNKCQTPLRYYKLYKHSWLCKTWRRSRAELLLWRQLPFSHQFRFSLNLFGVTTLLFPHVDSLRMGLRTCCKL